mmetsp:Transcript_10830/g.29023  ORF Transcript_10830/g.29023 Transcript_10830/m.29023 type:complete len:213 (+) Transcript_10830:27-665(+)
MATANGSARGEAEERDVSAAGEEGGDEFALPEGLECRAIRRGELDALRRFHRRVFPVVFPEWLYNYASVAPAGCFLAAFERASNGGDGGGEKEARIVACSCCVLEGGGGAYLAALGVLAAYRSRGVGSALLSRTLRTLQRTQPHVELVYLHVQLGNDDALRFYQRHGFERQRTQHNYYARLDPPHAHVLQKRLRRSLNSSPHAGAAIPSPPL